MKTWKTLEDLNLDLDHTLETALDFALAAPDLENAKDKTWSKSIFLMIWNSFKNCEPILEPQIRVRVFFSPIRIEKSPTIRNEVH